MASVNKVIVLGRLGQDPELKYTQSQKAVCSLNVATSEKRNDQNGNPVEKTEWHKVVLWDKKAELAAQYLTKGRMVFVEGKLTTRSWEDQNGQKRYTTEIVGHNVQFLPDGNGQQQQGQFNQAPAQQQPSATDQFDHHLQRAQNHAQQMRQAPADNGGGFAGPANNSAMQGAGGMSSSQFDNIPF